MLKSVLYKVFRHLDFFCLNESKIEQVIIPSFETGVVLDREDLQNCSKTTTKTQEILAFWKQNIFKKKKVFHTAHPCISEELARVCLSLGRIWAVVKTECYRTRLDNTSCHTSGVRVTLKTTPNTLLLKSTRGAGVKQDKSEMKVLLNVLSLVPNVDLERHTTSSWSKIVCNTIL